MFGTLTIQTEESVPLSRRCALRLRPASGLTVGRGLYRMTLFRWAQVTLCSSWKEGMQQKRVGEALVRLRAEGVSEVLLPREWEGLARQQGLVPMSTRSALEACAADGVFQACQALGLPLSGVGLAVYGKAIPAAAHMELLSLARSVRTMRIYGEDNDSLRAKLWRGCGIVDRGPMPQGVPVIGLVFHGGGQPEGCLLVLDLTGEEEPCAPGRYRPRLVPPEGALAQCPPGVPAHRFAAALFTVGALRAREIHVSRLDIADFTPYNKEI